MAVVQRGAAVSAVDFVSAYAAAAAEVVATIPACDMGGRVAACPGWSTYDLVVHLGNTHAWAATIVETGRSAAEQNDRPRWHHPRTVARWYAAKAEDLLQVLRAAAPDEACWTFSADHATKGFWPRRQTHETLVHLADLQHTRSRTSDIPAHLAVDGIAEVLEVFLSRMHARGRPATLDAPLLLHASDTDDRWLLTPRVDGPPAWRHVEPTGHVGAGHDLVTAPAADLMLLLWRRLSPEHPSVTLDGDPDRLAAFLSSPLTP